MTHRARRLLLSAVFTVATAATLALSAGCEERLNNPPAQQQAKSQPVLEGGGSASGKAVSNARAIEAQNAQRQAEIDKAAEAVNGK